MPQQKSQKNTAFTRLTKKHINNVFNINTSWLSNVCKRCFLKYGFTDFSKENPKM